MKAPTQQQNKSKQQQKKRIYRLNQFQRFSHKMRATGNIYSLSFMHFVWSRPWELETRVSGRYSRLSLKLYSFCLRGGMSRCGPFIASMVSWALQQYNSCFRLLSKIHIEAFTQCAGILNVHCEIHNVLKSAFWNQPESYRNQDRLKQRTVLACSMYKIL